MLIVVMGGGTYLLGGATVALVVVGTVVLLVAIGALTLRDKDKLSERGLVKLISMAFNRLSMMGQIREGSSSRRLSGRR